MVKTNSSNPRIESFGDNNLLVYVSSPPEHNAANLELIKMLSRYYGVPFQRIKIKLGLTSMNKLVEIM